MKSPSVAHRAPFASTMSKVEFQEWNERMARAFDPDFYHESSNMLIRWIERKRVRTLLRFLSVQPHHRVLDVGVGAGNILKKIRARERIGLDLSPFLLAKARARLGTGVTLIQGDAEELTQYVPPASCDRVYCSEVLEHVQHPDRVLAQMAAVLKPDGVAVVSVPHERVINTVKSLLKGLGIFRLLFPQVADHMEYQWHLHVFDAVLLRRLCERPFVIEHITAVPAPFLPIRLVARLRPRPLWSHLPRTLCCPSCSTLLEERGGRFCCLSPSCGEVYDTERGTPILLRKGEHAVATPHWERRENSFKDFFKRWPHFYSILFYVVGPMLFTGLTARKFVRRFDTRARILHAGSGTRRLSPNCLNVDLYPFDGVDVVADLARLPFADGSFDAVTCEQVLEHLRDPFKAASEIRRVVRPGGTIHVAVPFVFPWHPSPSDYSRWTQEGLSELFPDCAVVERGVLSGPCSALTAFLASFLAMPFSFGVRSVHRFLQYPLLLLLSPLKLLDLLFVHLPGAEHCSASIYLVLRAEAR